MAWKHEVCEGKPGKVSLFLEAGQPRLAVEPQEGKPSLFSCSMAALLGVLRGLRTYLASADGECVLHKKERTVVIKTTGTGGQNLTLCVPIFDFALSLSRLADAVSVQRRVSVR